MRRPLILVLASVLALVAGLIFATLAWIPQDGSMHGWDAREGELVVPDAGIAFLPRWSYRRLPGGPLSDRLQTGSREGVKVAIRVAWNPSPGRYLLSAGELPASQLVDSLEPTARRVLATMPLACLIPKADTTGNCPDSPEGEVRMALGERLGTKPGAIVVTLDPDPTAVRSVLLGAISRDLPSEHAKVLLLGFDGFDWDLVLPWVREGKMPNLDRLMKAGTWGSMETLVPTLSPLIWTTIATGVSPDRHGILDFVERDADTGAMVPITSRGRKVPAIWNLASALGRQVGVVGWWASWPAERVRGVMASDRLYYTLTQGFDKELLRQDPPDLVYPPEASAELSQLRDRAVAETDYEAVKSFQPIEESRYRQALADDLGMDDPVDGFRRILASTRTYLGAGLQVAADSPDLLMVYLEGTDTIGHVLSQYRPPSRIDIDASEAARYTAAVPRYFQAVDHWIGRYLEAAPLDEYAILIVSDHGFRWGDDRPKGLSGTAGPTAPLWHKNDAVFIAAGKGVSQQGRAERKGSIYQVAPTIASLMGIPGDDEWTRGVLPGTPAPTLAAIDYQGLVPPSSYSQTLSGPVPVDEEAIAKLRALGYLGANDESAADATAVSTNSVPTPSPPPLTASPNQPSTASGEDTMTRAGLNNLAVLKINQGDYEEAEEILRRAIRKSPDYASPHYNLRRMYMESKRYEEADRELWIAIGKGLRDPERTLDRAAADYDGLDLSQRSRDLLTRAIEKFPGHEPFWAHLLVVHIRLEECDEANQVGTRAAQRFPNSAPVHSFWGLAAACAGDTNSARRALERSLEIKPDQPRLRTTLQQLNATTGG